MLLTWLPLGFPVSPGCNRLGGRPAAEDAVAPELTGRGRDDGQRGPLTQTQGARKTPWYAAAPPAPRFALLAVCLAANALAAQERPLLGVTFDGGKQAVSVPMQVTLLLAALTFLPAIVMAVTPFLRITIVLHFLRQALGTQNTPSNQVLLGLALFLTALIMTPLVAEIREKAWDPFAEGKITQSQALDLATPPVKKFLLRYAREKDIQLFLQISRKPSPASADQLELSVLAPAYVLSELKAGFQIGAVLFLPFLVIDIVVASVTLSIGMVQLPPVMLSAPFKILLFVLVDGWNLLVGSLVRSFYA
jgi:flagellar biosynthetic protein FliP